jgi:cell division protein ZapB
MENKTIVELLDQSVSKIAEHYKALKTENALLEERIQTLNNTIENKNKNIEKLTEENALKDLEIEDIISKVENILK